MSPRSFTDPGPGRPTMESRIRGYWQGEASAASALVLTAVTAPASALFGVGVRLRNRAFDTGLLKARTAEIPVVSVGNLSVGGTGKTPVVRWVVERLRAQGRTPAVVSRGYGADELALHRRWHPDVLVVADPDRVAAARNAAESGADVVVVDDGFQHRALARDADIVLLSADDPFPPRLLPRGPWREPLAALERASLVLVTGKGEAGSVRAEGLLAVLHGLPRHPPLGRISFRAAGWEPLGRSEAGAEPPARPAPGESVLAVASIAHPEGFCRVLDEAGLQAELLAFPDHHPYSEADVRRILAVARGRRVVTTEKDAVKLCAFPALAGSDPAPGVLVLALEPAPGVLRLLDRLLDRALARGGARP